MMTEIVPLWTDLLASFLLITGRCADADWIGGSAKTA